ncbi:Hypp5985 [Branchiostoma lanceolatum]|nr:Hypp5985 [Branchiostoma lanceolatum]
MVSNNNTGPTNKTMTETPIPPVPLGNIIGGLAALVLLMSALCFCAVACRKNTEANFTELKPSDDTFPADPAAMEMGNVNAPPAGHRVRHVYNPTLFPRARSYSPPRAIAAGYPGMQNTAFTQY